MSDVEVDLKGKRRRIEEYSEGEEVDAAPAGSDLPMPRHRVTTKGKNVPEHVETFEALRGQYSLSSHLLQNLAQHGYKRPTGIQSYGIPILMEVCVTLPSSRFRRH